jgi:hypothetical protein
VLSIFEVRHLNRFWINHFKIQKTFRAACQQLATVAWPGSPPGRLSRRWQQCRPPSRRAFKALTHPRAFTPSLILPIPFPNWHSTPSRRVATLLYSSPLFAHAADAVSGKPRLSQVGVCREHLPYPFSPFKQGLAARSAPPLGSWAVSTVATLPPVRNSAARCGAFLPCTRAATHSPIANSLGFGPRKPPPLPRFDLSSPSPSSIRWAPVSNRHDGPRRGLSPPLLPLMLQEVTDILAGHQSPETTGERHRQWDFLAPTTDPVLRWVFRHHAMSSMCEMHRGCSSSHYCHIWAIG